MVVLLAGGDAYAAPVLGRRVRRDGEHVLVPLQLPVVADVPTQHARDLRRVIRTTARHQTGQAIVVCVVIFIVVRTGGGDQASVVIVAVHGEAGVVDGAEGTEVAVEDAGAAVLGVDVTLEGGGLDALVGAAWTLVGPHARVSHLMERHTTAIDTEINNTVNCFGACYASRKH